MFPPLMKTRYVVHVETREVPTKFWLENMKGDTKLDPNNDNLKVRVLGRVFTLKILVTLERILFCFKHF